MELQFTACNGSGNEFLMIDCVGQDIALSTAEWSALARRACNAPSGIACDGLLLAVADGAGYGMRMFNTDGSEAEMCGNGIRCVARCLEKYIGSKQFTLSSGGKPYLLTHSRPIYGELPTFGVQIEVQVVHEARVIPELDKKLLFTELNLGNPHAVAVVEHIDLEQLTALGERAQHLPAVFARGVNVSLIEICGHNEIFVATFERGVGLTRSCGTAMTAASRAVVELGLCDWGHDICVFNRGGMVRCNTTRTHTSLTGNATFEAEGIITDQSVRVTVENTVERQQYEQFVMATAR